MDMLQKEIGGALEFSKLKQQKKLITLHDIKADIYTMTEPDEILEYISAIEANKELVEEGALEKILIYKLKAKELSEKTKKQASIDTLTKLFTRRVMRAQLDNLISLAAGRQQAFSFILVDIDHFKVINDTYGHPTGDKVLKEIAKHIRMNVRGSDIICRYGGEEITIILPRTDLDAATNIAENLRKIIGTSDFYSTDNKKLNLTISCGVSTYGPDGVSRPDIINAADRRLYRAKKTGRNRVVNTG